MTDNNEKLWLQLALVHIAKYAGEQARNGYYNSAYENIVNFFKKTQIPLQVFPSASRSIIMAIVLVHILESKKSKLVEEAAKFLRDGYEQNSVQDIVGDLTRCEKTMHSFRYTHDAFRMSVDMLNKAYSTSEYMRKAISATLVTQEIKKD